MASSTPIIPEATSLQTKIVTSVAFAVGTASVATVSYLSGLVLHHTLRLTTLNLRHLISSKGKVWETTKFRNFDK